MSSLEPSGMEMMLLSAASEWNKYGLECDILATSQQIGSLASRLAEAGYCIHHLPFRSKIRLVPSIGFLKKYFQLCQSRRYSVVHIHTEEAPPLFAGLARLAGVPRIALSIHNTFDFNGFLRTRKTLERWTVRRIGARYGFISDGVAACEQERFGNIGTRVRNWVDTDYFRPPSETERIKARTMLNIPNGAKVLLSVGNCNSFKNHGALIRSLGLLGKVPDLLYLHVGRETSNLDERALAKNLQVETFIRFEGPQRDVRQYLWAADVFVMPSLHEGLPISVLEALAAGCPAVLSDIPGIVELGQFAPGAIFIQPEADSIAEGISTILGRSAPKRTDLSARDSDSIRRDFSPAEGIKILYRDLYGLTF